MIPYSYTSDSINSVKLAFNNIIKEHSELLNQIHAAKLFCVNCEIKSHHFRNCYVCSVHTWYTCVLT